MRVTLMVFSDLVQLQVTSIYQMVSDVPALNRKKTSEFTPQSMRINSHVMGSDVYGIVQEDTLIKHKIMLLP